VQPGQWKIKRAALQLLDGKVLAYPTDAIWALGCDPENETATLRLLAITERSPEQGLMLTAGSVAQIEHLLDGLTSKQRRVIVASWPGPATWLVPDVNNEIPAWIKGASDGVALHVSAHPLVQALCIEFGGPVVSTSACRGTAVVARSALQVVKHLGKDIDGVLHGKPGGLTPPDSIIDSRSGRVVP
jgi:L-threonylcarbamoyladenylate synthase